LPGGPATVRSRSSTVPRQSLTSGPGEARAREEASTSAALSVQSHQYFA